MTQATTTYTIHDYQSGESLGEVAMTAEQWAAYEAKAQQPEGLIAYGDLDAEMKHVHGPVGRNVTIYLS